MSRSGKLSRAVAAVVESLEDRMLLTTVVGGGVDPITGQIRVLQYEYLDANNHIGVVSVGGDTTAELIFGRVRKDNVLIISDLIPPPPPNTQGVDGRDLFSIYVSRSDANSFITVSERQNNAPFALIPFDGSAGTFRIVRADNGRIQAVTPDGGTGNLLLGARTVAVNGQTDSGDRPIVSKSFSGLFGVRPDLGRITAGLQVAPGLDFGKFYFGGTVIGQVNVPGSMDTFYAGNLWTGDARGVTRTPVTGQRRVPNFIIGGDLHSLIVSGSIGTNTNTGNDNPQYLTGFDAQIGGIIGMIKADDTMFGGADVIHGRVSTPFGGTVDEIEGITGATAVNDRTAGWAQGRLEGSASIGNDDFNNPQVLPSFAGRKGRSSVFVDGTLVTSTQIADWTDYYGMEMLAGESMTVQLSPAGALTGLLGTGLIHVGIYDPDGRLIATDFANATGLDVEGQPIRITADRPGLYRIAVASYRDADFNGPGGEFGVTTFGEVPYQLAVTEAGDVALGAVVTGADYFDGNAGLGNSGIFVENGDMGGIESGGSIYSLTDATAYVRKGSLRGVEATTVGIWGTATAGVLANTFRSGFNAQVPRGHVGLLRATTGNAMFQGSVATAIGGDYQVVSAGVTLYAILLADRGIGVIRAGDMSTLSPSAFFVNADQTGDDGIIDLIDVTGDMGTLAGGGPQIDTGGGGDVRYIHVGGQVFRDRFFGGGSNDVQTFAPGENVKFTDDSGATIDLVPVASNPFGGTNVTNPTLSVISYGIESGGSALINVTSTGSVRVGVGGSGGAGAHAHAEIGTLMINSTQGNRVVSDTNTGQLIFSQPTTGTGAVNLDVLIDGSGTGDIYSLVGSDLTSVRNQTPGEIVNIDANQVVAGGTIGSLEGYSIGIPTSHTGALVGGLNTVQNVYPFNGQRTAVVASNILNVQASGPIGNIAVSGSIGNIQANNDGKTQRGRGFVEGIDAPVVAGSNIGSVNIGQGLLPQGSGNVGLAGIFAGGSIGEVRNQGAGSDIRGAIIAGQSIGTIGLSKGAIIGARIMVVSSFADARRIQGTITLPSTSGSLSNPVFQLGEVGVGSGGGIIGSFFAAANMGPITVSRGFGIVTSFFETVASGVMAPVTAEGYGVRSSTFRGGADMQSLSASAKPKNVSVKEYTASVRESETRSIDPFFGQAPNSETDLHIALGTSGRKPRLAGITDTGVIEDTLVQGSHDLTSVFASQIRGTTAFHFGNAIGRVRTRGVISGLEMTAGKLSSLLAGGDISNLTATIAGPIVDFHAQQSVLDTTLVRATGPNGNVTDFIVDGDMNGDLSSSRKISFLAIGGDLGASSLITAQILEKKQIKGGIFGTIKVG